MTMSVEHLGMLRTQAVKVNSSKIRNETFQGREYLVVPLTALVEGVIQGANSDKPELVRINTIKKSFQGWNGRPLVMNHPQVNGEYVSANSPDVLEEWHFGFIFNSAVKGKKLEMEGWIDILRAQELGGEFESTLTRLQNKEEVEISTGLFSEVNTKAKGDFTVNGAKKAYHGEWTTITPDHLALLSEGTKGACSIEDGCGTKVNKAEAEVHVNCAGECTCGGGAVSDTSKAGIVQAFDNMRAVVLKALSGGEDEGRQGKVDGEGQSDVQDPGQEDNSGQGPADGQEVGATDDTPAEEQEGRALSAILTHSIAPGLVFSDVEKQVRIALRRRAGTGSWYCILITQDHVIYTAESYGYYYSPSYLGGGTYQLAYSIDADGNVDFQGEPEEVNVITKVVPARGVTINSNPEVEPMAEEPKETAAPAPAPASGATEAAPAPAVQAAPMKVQTTDEYIAAAPPEMQGVLREGMRLQQERRTALIDGIKANSANKFSDDALKAFDTPTLENLASLANVTIDYSGRAGAQGLQVHSSANADDGFVPAPDVFAAPSANAQPA